MAEEKSQNISEDKILLQLNDYFATSAECEKYKSLIDEMSEAIFLEDKNNNIVYANYPFSKLVGIKRDNCTGRSVFDFFDDKNKKYFIKEVEKGLIGESPEKQIDVINKNGKKIPVLIGATSISENCRLITMTDLSKTAHVQRRLKDDTEKYFRLMQESYREIGMIKRKLDYLNDLINFASSDILFEEYYNFVVNSIIIFTKADACVFRLYDHSKKKFLIKYAFGVSSDWYNQKPPIYKGSLIERAVKSGGILKIEDIQKETLYPAHKLAKKNNFSSLVIGVIGIREKLIGYTSIYFIDKEKMRDIDEDFLSVFLKQAAIILSLYD